MVETVTIQSEDKGPTLEEQAAAQEAAAEKAQGEPKLNGEKPERPENVPEKFWNAETGEVNTEALLKSYSELEKARSAPKDGEQATGEEAAAQEAVESAGLDMEALSAEYATNGSLTEESYEALAKVGITKDMVQAYITGQEAQAAALQQELLEPLGGNMEAYEEMTSWAADNLDDKAIDDFNKVLESGNTSAIKMAVQNLHAKYTDANGSEPGRQLSGKGTSSGTSVYESTADLMKDMQNPEYERNPAFRAKVEQKLARSSIL
jgi:hypothetical protein